MKRMDRMMAILMALQQGSQTAQTLADRLEVSKRTVLRDIQALSEIGVPLYAATGPRGGYRLMEGFQLPPLQLDSEEALTVLLALDGMTQYSDGPFHAARWTVIDKITAVLPKDTLKQITPLRQHVEVKVPERHFKTPYLHDLITYCATSQWLKVMYRSERYHRSLTILPKRVHAAHGFWYCEAYSLVHQEVRTFRIDRIETVEELQDIQEIQHIQDHAKLQQEDSEASIVDQQETIFIFVKLTYRGALMAEQDQHMGHMVRQIGDEEWEVAFHCPLSEWDWAISFFYNMGMDAEVIEPQQLREELRMRAKHIVDKYNDSHLQGG